jgi:hypothetical protein
MRKLVDVRLLIKSDYGSTFVLNTVGETLAEALDHAVVSELDKFGREVSLCHVLECPGEVSDVATDLIKRWWRA